jgi:PKD repeat protein
MKNPLPSFVSVLVSRVSSLAVGILLLCAAPAYSGWLGGDWNYRRALEVNWDADHANGRELAMAEFYSAGHCSADGADVRVTDANGRIIPSHVLDMGPGDLVRIVFALQPHDTHYCVYFGNPNPPPPPAGTEDVKYLSGLLLEMRQFDGPLVKMRLDFPSAWDDAGPVIGKTLIDQPFYGLDPFGDFEQDVYKLSGSFSVPVADDYLFTGNLSGRGLLMIDGQGTLYIPGHAPDIRHRVMVHLAAGRHDFALYGQAFGHTQAFAIGWRLPNSPAVAIMPRNAFGILGHARAGALEEFGKTLVADFSPNYLGELFVADNDHYSHHYQFTAAVPNGADQSFMRFDWDLGDGTTAGGRTLEHVYVTPGIYPIRLTIRIGDHSDTQTIRLPVDRDWTSLDQPREDTALTQARIIARYDLSQIPEDWLPWIARIGQQARQDDLMLSAAGQMASRSHHANRDECLSTLRRLTTDLEIAGKTDAAIQLWSNVPNDSDLQPAAACALANQLIWTQADFSKALQAVSSFGESSDPTARRIYAEALILNNRADEGTKILNDLQADQDHSGTPSAAISGAAARTIEFRIDQRDWQSGQEEWETWQSRCPSSFVEGYSVLLRMKLMELRSSPAAAASVAEAFATAIPNSPYAPTLLDRASKLLAKTDPAKSKQLRDELKNQYPEDPLSQQ